MDLNWSTFLLEIFNFLVLVWILQRLFYKPLQQVIARRQQGIERQLTEAETLRGEAEQLQKQYESRLDDWPRERQQARETLQRDLQAERAKLEKELRESLQEQRQRAEVLEQRQRREQSRQLEQQALAQGGAFAAHLLGQGAGPELESRLLNLLLESLGEISAEQLAALRTELEKNRQAVMVASAFPLSKERREAVDRALQTLLAQPVHCEFVEDPTLVSGLRLSIGAWVLAANVCDELQGFAQLAESGDFH